LTQVIKNGSTFFTITNKTHFIKIDFRLPRSGSPQYSFWPLSVLVVFDVSVKVQARVKQLLETHNNHYWAAAIYADSHFYFNNKDDNSSFNNNNDNSLFNNNSSNNNLFNSNSKICCSTTKF
jgi:hypothetical protein